MTDVVGKLWGFCNTLRHDGINYGDYIEQLTYLLFLKLVLVNWILNIYGKGVCCGHDYTAYSLSPHHRRSTQVLI